MRHFLKIAEGVDTTRLLEQLNRNSHLWNEHPFRSTFDGTPFAEGDDILLRFSPLETSEFKNGFVGDEQCVWYPAREVLTEFWPLAKGLLASVGGYEIGRVIVSRLKPSAKIGPHVDDQGIYNNHGDRARYHIVLQGGAGSNFYCAKPVGEGPERTIDPDTIECATMRTGEVWWFNAAMMHWVENGSDDDRIHLLVDVRLYK